MAANEIQLVHHNGTTENARLELSAPSKMQGVENAGPSSYGKPKHRGTGSVALTSYLLRLTQHDLSNYLSEFTM